MDQIYVLNGRNISMNERYDYTVKYNKMKQNMEMNYNKHKGVDCIYQEESNNMICNHYRAYNFGNKKLCYVVF